MLFLVALASGCDTRERVVQPSIVITTVPEAAVGGSGKLGRIAGRVTGAGPGHQVVVYTKSGVWWVQPLTVEPFAVAVKARAVLLVRVTDDVFSAGNAESVVLP